MGWEPNERQYTLPLTRNGADLPDVPAHLTSALGDEAAAFVRRHEETPWLLYLAFNAPHTPHEPTVERLEKFAHIADVQRRRYLAQVSLMDDAIGTVTRALSESGQTSRTLVFFFSDNGGPVRNGANNSPLRGQKGDVYEGGVRVPFLVSWPGRLPAGSTYDEPVSSLDVLATTLAVAGLPMPSDKTYDGVNILPYLAGEANAAPHERLFWRRAGGAAWAVREGNWKLVRLRDRPPELYDLAADIGEARNIASANPEVTARLVAALEAWDKELVDPVFLGSSVKNEDWGPGGANQKKKQPRKQRKR
jgi:arylsulfatase A-like enzyme